MKDDYKRASRRAKKMQKRAKKMQQDADRGMRASKMDRAVRDAERGDKLTERYAF